ncbi:NAD-P-binding protein [Mycena floridula]|nr:NAD-P-binding protein [Mycena floridula]
MSFVVWGTLASFFGCLIVEWLRFVQKNDAFIAWSPQALAQSPRRWRSSDIDAVIQLHSQSPIKIEDRLPPRTGRRYIVTGGAGFVGGHIVLQLLLRGEDPKNIRILDIQPPTRRDLTVGLARDVQFIQVDVTDKRAVEAAFQAPWASLSTSEITVFHTVATIRFFERHPAFLPLSAKVNVNGTENVISAARSAGATILLFTSSSTVAVRSQRYFIRIWDRRLQCPVQTLTDDETTYPKRHEDAATNYTFTKMQAETIVRDADKTLTSTGLVLRTGVLRPGSIIFGPGGEIFDYAFRKKGGMLFGAKSFISYIYVENCALGHLCYEQRLIDLSKGSSNPDIGGQGFLITDPNPAPLGSEVHDTLTKFSDNQLKFRFISPTLLMILGYIVEAYCLARYYIGASRFAFLKLLMPPPPGDLINLQPATFQTCFHIFTDDSRARLSPEQGGLGYKAPYTTLAGLYKTWRELAENGPLVPQNEGMGFGHGKLGPGAI